MNKKIYSVRYTGEAKIRWDEFECDLIPVKLIEGFNPKERDNHFFDVIDTNDILFYSNLPNEAKLAVDTVMAGVVTNEENSQKLSDYIMLRLAIAGGKRAVEFLNEGVFYIDLDEEKIY